MAVNYVDGLTFVGVFFWPILAVANGYRAGAGWLTVPCVVAVLPVCFAVLYLGRQLTYLIAGVGLRLAQPMKPWLQGILMAPVVFFYFVLPICGGVAAGTATTYAVIELADFARRLGGWTGFAMASTAAVVSASVIAVFYRWSLRYTARQSGERAAQQ